MKRHRILASAFGLALLLTLAAGLTQAQGPGPAAGVGPLEALGTGFTYQGQLKKGDAPVSGDCAMAFRLYDASTGGNQVGSAITPTVAISNSLFTVPLDFGASPFLGEARWLGIQVKCQGDTVYADLGRQRLTAAPYALHSTSTGGLQGRSVASTAPNTGQVLKWSGSLWAPADDSVGPPGSGDIAAVYAGSGLTGGGTTGEVTVTVAFAGSGAATTVARSDHNHDGAYWSLIGNAGTTPGLHFLGTADPVSLTLAVDATPALRLVPGGPTPSLIGGHGANGATAGVSGAAIGGGGDGGNPNRVTDHHGSVGGGLGNRAGNDDGDVGNAANATVAGGLFNTASAESSFVGGGEGNTASSGGATVGGGVGNTASGGTSTIGGGMNNTATAGSATVGGGLGNTASDWAATVGGGQSNTASGPYATVGGGVGNTALGEFATIGGGDHISVTGQTATVAGGSWITATGDYATVGGGYGNRAITGTHTTVAGGQSNTASGWAATVAGGYGNTASGWAATVGGGWINTASGYAATVGGGWFNTASGDRATVAGGLGNTASDYAATVPGGKSNIASGAYSFAAGNGAEATHHGSFVWSSDRVTASERYSQFRARAEGGVRFDVNNWHWINIWDDGTNVISTSTGARLTIGGSWTNASDRDLKENFAAVDGQEVLARLAEVAITTWNYEAEGSSIQHMGPTAQDFYAAFGLGDSDVSIGTVDADGVALAAAQGLYELSRQQAARIEGLEAQNANLEARVAALEASAGNSSTRPAAVGIPSGLWIGLGLALLAGGLVVQRGRNGGAQ
jgi:hypothetical protein